MEQLGTLGQKGWDKHTEAQKSAISTNRPLKKKKKNRLGHIMPSLSGLREIVVNNENEGGDRQ